MEEHRSSRIEAARPAGITTACDRSRRHSFGSAAGGSASSPARTTRIESGWAIIESSTRFAMMMASSKSFAFATEGMPTADLARGVLLRWRTERPTAPRPGSRFSTPSSCRIRRRGWRRCARVRWMCWDRAGHQLPAWRVTWRPPITCDHRLEAYLERSFILTRVPCRKRGAKGPTSAGNLGHPVTDDGIRRMLSFLGFGLPRAVHERRARSPAVRGRSVNIWRAALVRRPS